VLQVPTPSSFEDEIAIAKFEGYKLPYTERIPAELIQARGEILPSVFHILVSSMWNKE
jgi:hypothetical protein